MKLSPKLHYIDEFGVRNYSAKFLALLALGSLYTVITLLAFLLLYFEQNVPGSNITNYNDAFWTLQMSASTIGFGDYFPVSFGGRFIVAVMFYIGVGLVGFIGALIADKIIGFANTNVRNRELRRQNDELLKHNKILEKKIDQLIQSIDTHR
ncbi:MAG TPA: two pore domain potassium channel family protein [Gammaproteobacteria bacterium]|nr:two pore domain potassium channel family protein [Gammaproteobacteria bacterium]